MRGARSIGEKLNRTPTCRQAKAQVTLRRSCSSLSLSLSLSLGLRPGHISVCEMWNTGTVAGISSSSTLCPPRSSSPWPSDLAAASITFCFFVFDFFFFCCPPIYGACATHCWVPASRLSSLESRTGWQPLTKAGSSQCALAQLLVHYRIVNLNSSAPLFLSLPLCTQCGWPR